MLSDEVIERVTERLVNRMEQANEYILQEIGKSIKKIGTLTPSQAQQLVQIMRYGGDFDKIITKLAQITKLNKKDIYKIFQEVAKMEQGYAKQFYKYRGKKFVKYDDNIQLQNMVNAIAKMTADKYVNLSKTYAFATTGKNGKIVYTDLSKKYQDVLDKAIISAGQGKESFDSAMRRTLRELAQSGIRSIDYESGKSMRADSALRMNLKEGLRTLHNEMQKQFGKQFDSDGVEISVHANPAPDHALAQGRQFSTSKYDKNGNEIEKGEWEKLQETGKAKDYKGLEVDMHLHRKSGKIATTFRPISTLNCYHFTYAIVLGVSEPNYTDEQLQKIIDDNNKGFDFEGKHYTNYQGTQLQRKLETEIRKQKDQQILARASGDMDLVRESQENIRQLTDKYNKLSKVSGLQTKIERMRVDGYHKIKVPEPVKEEPVKPQNYKPSDTFIITADESKKVNEYFINYYKNEEHLRPFEEERYKKLLEIKKQGYKDEKIELKNIDDCNKLLDRVHTELNGEEIKKTDFRLTAEASEQLYKLSIKSPAIMNDLKMNKASLTAEKNTKGVANTWLNTITLNNRYFSDYEGFKKMCVDYTTVKQTLSGKDYTWWSQVAKGNETKVIITHEFGHRLQKQITSNIKFKQRGETKAFDFFFKKYGVINSSGNRYIETRLWEIARDLIYEPIRRLQAKTGMTQKEIIQKYVSDYGKKNYDEMFAEVFANSQLGKSNPLADELIAFLIEIGEWEA